ncbi:MAG: MBL fold metallo-hydrolase [Dehalococcoidia bacterium]
MRTTIDRRRFLVLSGAAAAWAATACAGDDDSPESAAPTATSAGAAPSPTVQAGADAAAVGLRWYGQSMFLLTSPAGARIVLDPFNDIGYRIPPILNTDAATITHEHPDHNNDALGGGTATVLRGLTADGWADIDEIVDDIRIRTVQSFHDDQQGAQRGRNAIFVFEIAGLRFVHLGDLGHPLDDTHVAGIGGPVDALMVPVGGNFTIDAPQATEIVARLQPKLVFPMHYKTEKIPFPLATVDAFLEGKSVQRVGSTTTRITPDALPDETTTFVLDYE